METVAQQNLQKNVFNICGFNVCANNRNLSTHWDGHLIAPFSFLVGELWIGNSGYYNEELEQGLRGRAEFLLKQSGFTSIGGSRCSLDCWRLCGVHAA